MTIAKNETAAQRKRRRCRNAEAQYRYRHSAKGRAYVGSLDYGISEARHHTKQELQRLQQQRELTS